MHDIATNNKKYNDIRSIFNLYDGTLYLNLLAFQNIENLSIYYNNIIEKYETEGEDAFLREQLSWIGKTDEEADEIISDSKKNKVEKSRNRIIERLSGIIGIENSKEEFMCFRNEIRGDLMTVVQYPVKEITGDNIKKWKSCKNELTKTGKPISKPCMEFLRINCSIPFRVEVNNSKYTVQCIGENEDNK